MNKEDKNTANIYGDGRATFNGAVTAAKFIGDGSELTGLPDGGLPNFSDLPALS